MTGSIGVTLGPLPRYKDVVATRSTLLPQGITTTGGISQEYITAGSGKDLNNPYRDLTEQERHRLQAMVDDDYEIFVAEMAVGRKLDPQRIRNELGAGIFSAQQAVNVGLADAVMGRDEFFRHAATAAGLEPDKTVVERVAEPTGLSSLLGAKRAWGTSLPLSELGEKVVASASLVQCHGPDRLRGRPLRGLRELLRIGSTPPQLVKPLLVDAVVMPDLVDQGDGDLLEQLVLVLTHPRQGTTEQHHPVRQHPEPRGITLSEGGSLVDPEGLGTVLRFVLHHDGHVFQIIEQLLRESGQGLLGQRVEVFLTDVHGTDPTGELLGLPGEIWQNTSAPVAGAL